MKIIVRFWYFSLVFSLIEQKRTSLMFVNHESLIALTHVTQSAPIIAFRVGEEPR